VALQADVELGGSDQLFNLLVGRELMRDYQLAPQIVITGPVLEGIDAKVVNGALVGDKMSKSLGNYIGVCESAQSMYGKLMSICDDLMWRYYQLLSSLDMDEIRALQKAVAEGSQHPKAVKMRFAKEMVARFHSSSQAEHVASEFERVHARRELPEQMEEKAFSLGGDHSVGLLKLMSETGLASSNGEARRLVTQGGVSLNGQRVDDPRTTLIVGDYLLQVGKRRFLRIRVVS
jgi:tyrosyl-tRNA synthetase